MPEIGRYAKIPRPESISKLIEYLQMNDNIDTVEKLEDQILLVAKKNSAQLRVFMTNIYTLGIADVYEIKSHFKNINVIVTMSAWNTYTSEAKNECTSAGTGLFTFKEFLGAVHFDGKNFLYYTIKKDR